MKAELIKKEGNKVTFNLTVDNDKFESAVTKAYNKNKGKFNIQGFRKGKAPRKIIEAQYGKEVFYNDARCSRNKQRQWVSYGCRS